MADVIVCGAGAAGLSAAAMLRRSGMQVLVIERSVAVAASWRARYDELFLNTPGWMAAQPGWAAPRRRYGEFPSRDQWINYLEDYARHHRLDIRFGVEAQRIDPAPAGWLIQAGDTTLEAAVVVVATGYDHDPYLPMWPGMDQFPGEVLHAAAYRTAAAFAGHDVLIAGANTTGVELATHLCRAGASRVRIACRTPPNLVRRKMLGVPVGFIGLLLMPLPRAWADWAGRRVQHAAFGDLPALGLPTAPLGIRTVLEQTGRGPSYDDGFAHLLRSGQIQVVAAVHGFDGASVILADGTRIRPDTVIAATGYRRGLQSLVGHLGVLGPAGTPVFHGGSQHPLAPRLFFIGYRITLAGQMPAMRADARGIARAARRAVRHMPRPAAGGRP